jgi:hypothetical protein
MIQGQIFNFDSNKLEASRYRVALKGTGKDSGSKEAESFLLSRRFNFKKLNFSFRKRGNLLDAQLIDTNLRNLNFYMYYINKNINSIKRIEDAFYLKSREYFKVLNKDLSKIKSLITETDLRLNSKYTKVKVYDIFQEKDFEEIYDLVDVKRDLRFRKEEQCQFKEGYIETKKINRSSLDIVSIELLQENSFFSDSLKAIEITKDSSLIYRKDKFWHYIVGAVQSLEDLQKLPHKKVGIEFVVNFDGYEDLNSIYIEFGSSLPVIFNKNQLSYYDKDTKAWELIDEDTISILKDQNRSKIFFNTVRTNKIKINLVQNKYHDTNQVFDEDIGSRILKDLVSRSYLSASNKEAFSEIKRVYDLSILHLECSRECNSHLGFYREAEPVTLNKPLSLNIEQEIFFESENCFIEKYAHIVLYGEESFAAHKKKSKNFNNTKRVNVKIPLPNSSHEEVELLRFQNGISKVNLFPKILNPASGFYFETDDIIKVNKINLVDGTKTTLSSTRDFCVSLDGGSYFNEENAPRRIDTRKIGKPKIYNFLIKLLVPELSNCVYTVEYILNDKIYCGYGDSLVIQSGELVFGRKFQGSVGFVRPSFVLRNQSKVNQSSKIKTYKVLIEEIDSDEDSYIEYETFLEMEKRGTSDVV